MIIYSKVKFDYEKKSNLNIKNDYLLKGQGRIEFRLDRTNLR